ncbi:MAG: hypothetical protein ACLR8P_09575 [Clostridium fessum]
MMTATSAACPCGPAIPVMSSGNLTLYQDGRLGLDHIKKEADIQEGDKDRDLQHQ